jgi:hypothetical protein
LPRSPFCRRPSAVGREFFDVDAVGVYQHPLGLRTLTNGRIAQRLGNHDDEGRVLEVAALESGQ